MRTIPTLAILAASLLLAALPAETAWSASAPTGPANTNDECAKINNLNAPTPRCARLELDSQGVYYAYAAPRLVCKIVGHASEPAGTSPTIGLWKESNGVPGLQIDFPADTPIVLNCHPW